MHGVHLVRGVLAASALLLFANCVDTPAPTDAGVEPDPAPDVVLDAGDPIDAGDSIDAAVDVDAGRDTDAGDPADAGSVPSDAGAGAPTDAGAVAPVDAGGAPDGGVTTSRRYFAPGSFWTTDISEAPVSPDSAAIIADLEANGGWGNNDIFQIDFSIEVLTSTSTTPLRTFTPTNEHYSPDCDITPVPVPVDGNLEGEDGYRCDSDGDCHLIVHAPDENRLYEMWRANISDADVFTGGCLAVWSTSVPFADGGRGEQCTSADAAGFPIAPLLFSADEVAAGHIDHAIRFILPNNRVRERTYVPPATHGTNTSGGPNAPQYGVHFRLRADYPIDTLPTEGARVVARALQRYGMFHADGGNIALTAQSDRHTTAKWEDLLGPRDLQALDVTDFEVIHHGDDIPVTYDCQRTPLVE